MKIVFLSFLLLGTLGTQLSAQNRQLSEAYETLRFVRLAETKKKLDLSEEKLLKLNDVLDVYEKNRFDLNNRERRLHARIQRKNYTDKDAEVLLKELFEAKQAQLEIDTNLWTEIRTFLTPAETLDFLVFYQKFQRDVQRRVRMLQENKKRNRRGGFNQQRQN